VIVSQTLVLLSYRMNLELWRSYVQLELSQYVHNQDGGSVTYPRLFLPKNQDSVLVFVGGGG
jgi:hypothetical protein